MNAGARRFLVVACLLGFAAVALGAFGAHALKARIGPASLAVFETGVRYQMYHALALLAVALRMEQRPARALATSGWLFVAGVVLFSGSLYLLSTAGWRWLGPVTPLGGVCFLAGWIAFLVAAVKR